ncbi:MAG TPA: hypothetical protein PLK29_05060 [Chiayiivirga sp.]|nr:hypothetical protein [Chiayiivirga sp.]
MSLTLRLGGRSDGRENRPLVHCLKLPAGDFDSSQYGDQRKIMATAGKIQNTHADNNLHQKAHDASNFRGASSGY